MNSFLSIIAILDAYAAPWEHPKKKIADAQVGVNNFTRYCSHPSPERGMQAGQYTDDTQMSIAVCEVLLRHRSPNALNFADAFVQAYRRDPRPGYASGFQQALDTHASGQALLQALTAYGANSTRNGAAMRAGIIGILRSDLNEVKRLAALQASLTHNSPEGIDSAIAAALMVYYGHKNLGPKSELPAFTKQHVPSMNTTPFQEAFLPCDGPKTIQAALMLITQCTALSQIAIAAVRIGGDTDTLAVIAGGAASQLPEIDKSIPRTLVDGLENGTYGRDYLHGLGARLT